jgi:hypothetical protein
MSIPKHKMRIPKCCPVCSKQLIKDRFSRYVCMGHFAVYFNENHTQIVAMLFISNKINFVWYEEQITRDNDFYRFCNIEGPMGVINVPWIDLPEVINMELWSHKVRTLLTFS